ncbi:MAG: HAD-IB family phosphatase [Candidatus Omnitrophica bacterium]|nr:HAD-IB family phosphatase [Candidatus Omnitrophota bacterium]
MKQPLLIACDFDGTVTKQDTLVEILDRYGSASWRSVQDQVVAGTLSIREGLRQEMSSVRADLHQLKNLLSERVALDAGFPPFFSRMRNSGIPVVLLSGGFDLCVETVMQRHGLWPVPYLANRLVRDNGSWRVEYPHPSAACDNCGHCKADAVKAWKEQGYFTVFVGNGVTDRCAAEVAGLTFAKDELAAWCATQKIPAVAYATFHDIEADLNRRGWL